MTKRFETGIPGAGRSKLADPPEPTPEDPREHEPMRDPPIFPEHDDGLGKVQKANRPAGITAPNPSPDSTVSDSSIE